MAGTLESIAPGYEKDATSRMSYAIHPDRYVSTPKRIATIKQLLESGKADPNYRDYDGTPVIDKAVAVGNQEIVKLLLKAGADVNAVGPRYNFTPLRTAIEITKDVEMVKILLAAGANILHDIYGVTILQRAQRGDYTPAINKAILEKRLFVQMRMATAVPRNAATGLPIIRRSSSGSRKRSGSGSAKKSRSGSAKKVHMQPSLTRAQMQQIFRMAGTIRPDSPPKSAAAAGGGGVGGGQGGGARKTRKVRK
jgi:hypothetical protein